MERLPKEEVLKDGGHSPMGCPTVVENAAKWVAELLLEERWSILNLSERLQIQTQRCV